MTDSEFHTAVQKRFPGATLTIKTVYNDHFKAHCKEAKLEFKGKSSTQVFEPGTYEVISGTLACLNFQADLDGTLG